MKSFYLALGCVALFMVVIGAQPAEARPAVGPSARGAEPGEGGQAAATQETPALNDAQKSAVRAIQGDSEQKTLQAARELAGVVQKIYENNLADTPNDELRTTLDNQMKELVWQMVAIKGNAMWAAFRLLTPEQKRIVRTEIAKPRPTGDLPDVLDLIVRTFQVPAR
jgi:Spy/CpxP family protein refolding chaperone